MGNMSQTVEIHDQIWNVEDIQQNVDWSKQQKWKFTDFTVDNDHEHCLICYWTIFKSSEAESGKAFQFHNNWLCQECYGKFVAR